MYPGIRVGIRVQSINFNTKLLGRNIHIIVRWKGWWSWKVRSNVAGALAPWTPIFNSPARLPTLSDGSAQHWMTAAAICTYNTILYTRIAISSLM